ncbi:hypothetical protein TCON_2745 [Astathelohania contejeani]|uniref:LAGLIDADG homing endonuclease n=1 Tax=Astathelohania contejeani TaxID=164912 RepID=A0ABQ7HV50_9MICR|nr:hypothetical protein TCON_2745 [Thelohania contejeani]
MGGMVKGAESFFSAIRLDIKRNKSATNDPFCEETARLLNDAGVYKYLSIIENRGSNIARESFEKVKRKMIMGVDRLCNSNLNAKNSLKQLMSMPSLLLIIILGFNTLNLLILLRLISKYVFP